MRRTLVRVVLLLLVAVGAGAGAGNQDVNRDGRFDEADVTALGRMVAGLDPVDLTFDQNGDSELTLDDVNVLLDLQAAAAANPADAGPVLGFSGNTRPAATPAARQPTAIPDQVLGNQATGALMFYAIRQMATGQCVVVAGDAGISPGDTVFGVFPTFQPAQDVVISQCAGNRPQTPPAPSDRQPAPANLSLLASPILAAPKYDNDESTKGIFFISLETGNAFFIDKVKGSPLSVRTRTLNQNIFKALGRTPGESAQQGDILVGSIRKKSGQMHALLLVDTTTGALSYIADLDSRSYDGRLQPIRGKPALDLVGDGGPCALAMWEDHSGKTEGAFLINGKTGQGIYFEGVGDLEPYLTVRRTPAVRPMPGGVSVLPIHSSDESTSHLLLIDDQDGTLTTLGLPRKEPWHFTITTLSQNIYIGIPREATVQTPHRLVPIAINSSSGATDGAIVVDVGSGSMVMLDHLRDPQKTRLIGVSRNIYEKLPKEVARPRVITAVCKIDSSGASEGAWLFDSVTGNIVFLDNLQHPGNLEISTVEERTR